jgi:hypothetical protein
VGTYQRIDIPILHEFDQYNYVLFTGEWAIQLCSSSELGQYSAIQW